MHKMSNMLFMCFTGLFLPYLIECIEHVYFYGYFFYVVDFGNGNVFMNAIGGRNPFLRKLYLAFWFY